MGVGLRKQMVVGCIAVAASLLVACSGKSEADLLKAAKDLVQQRQYAGATIQLKNVLQQNQSSAEARFLLATVLIETGELGAADTELRKARAQGQPDVDVVPALARVMIAMGEPKKVIAEFEQVTLNDVAADADLGTSLAKAYAETGEKDKSWAKVGAVLRAKPDYSPAVLLQARAMADKLGPEAALQQLQAAGPALDKSAEAAHLRGNIKLNGKQDIPGAIKEFQQSLALDARYVPAHVSLIALYLYQDDIKAANEQVAALKKALPNSAVARLYEAQMAYLGGDNKLARQLIQQLLKVAPGNLRALYIAGAVELKLNNSLQAIAHLNKALSLAPDLMDARLLLARTHLRAAQPAQALKTLSPALELPSPSLEALTLAAEAHLQIGDPVNSEVYFKRALKLKPDDARSRTALALASLAKGDDAGFKELEAIAKTDDSSLADMALINSRLQRGQFDAALEDIAALEKKLVDKPLPAYLRGRLLLLREDLPGARKSFEQALSKDAAFFPAVNSLALLDLMEKRPEASQKRLESLLKTNPGSTEAMMSIADLRVTQGASKDEVIGLIRNAIKASPGEATPQLMLVEYLLLNKDAKGALEAAQLAIAAAPNSLELLDALGRAQVMAGQPLQAINTFSKLTQAQPNVALSHVRTAEVHAQLNNHEAALRSLKAALAITPNMLQAQQMALGLEMRSARPQNAIQIAKTIQRQRPNQAVGFLLEGNVEAEMKRWPQAIAAYKAGLEKNDPNILPGRLHFALLAAKKTAEADELAARWTKTHPKDVGFVIYLGDLALAGQDWALAEQRYRTVLELEPAYAVAANNIAWLMIKQKKTGAVTMAEKAVALAPKNPSMLDTLAQALAEEGQVPKAVETAKQALALAPTAPPYRLSLAKLYLRAGDKSKARDELQQLQALDEKFAGQAEVAELLKSL